ncbi:MAG: response regulator [Actinomycetota bacterium]
MRIVLVDDHDYVRRSVRSVLEQRPDLHVLGEAGNGLEAVELAERLRPDVVLMDLRMPIMDGVEATRRIRRTCPGTAVLAFSSSDADVDVAAAIEAGAWGYVVKGTHADRLVGAIRSAGASRA